MNVLTRFFVYHGSAIITTSTCSGTNSISWLDSRCVVQGLLFIWFYQSAYKNYPINYYSSIKLNVMSYLLKAARYRERAAKYRLEAERLRRKGNDFKAAKYEAAAAKDEVYAAKLDRKA